MQNLVKRLNQVYGTPLTLRDPLKGRLNIGHFFVEGFSLRQVTGTGWAHTLINAHNTPHLESHIQNLIDSACPPPKYFTLWKDTEGQYHWYYKTCEVAGANRQFYTYQSAVRYFVNHCVCNKIPLDRTLVQYAKTLSIEGNKVFVEYLNNQGHPKHHTLESLALYQCKFIEGFFEDSK